MRTCTFARMCDDLRIYGKTSAQKRPLLFDIVIRDKKEHKTVEKKRPVSREE